MRLLYLLQYMTVSVTCMLSPIDAQVTAAIRPYTPKFHLLRFLVDLLYNKKRDKSTTSRGVWVSLNSCC